MPLKIILGVKSHKIETACTLLREAGAVSTNKNGNRVEGIFRGIADPNGARADKLVDWINNDMMKQPRFKTGIWLEDVETA